MTLNRPQTPTPNRPNQPAAPDTPISRGSHDTGAAVPQSDLKKLMRNELPHAVFEVEPEDLTPIDDDRIRQVCQEMKENTYLLKIQKAIQTGKPLQVQGKPDLPKWPESTDSERKYYQPLAALLNIISSEFGKCWKEGRQPQPALVFSSYDKNMKEGIGMADPLKPDLLVAEWSITGQLQVSWTAVEAAVEVKGEWPGMVAQAATYARAIMNSQRYRLFSWVIVFHHKHSIARVVFFNRQGAPVTTKCALKTKDGFINFVHWFVLLAIPNAISPAFDDTRADFELPSDESPGDESPGDELPDDLLEDYIKGSAEKYYVYQLSEELCYRGTTVRGRGTEVQQITRLRTPASRALRRSKRLATQSASQPASQQAESQPASQPVSQQAASQPASQPAKPLPAPKRRTTPSKAVPDSEMDSIIVKQSQARIQTIKLPKELFDGEPPEKLIFKDSWPLAGRHKNEGQLFEAVKGCFGVPNVLATYPLENHSFPVPENMKYWNVFGEDTSEGKPPKPEKRVHMRSITDTQGLPLRSASGPRELVEALVHAMIGEDCSLASDLTLIRRDLDLGYLNMFRTGWQQRDVSNGNILLVPVVARVESYPAADLIRGDLELEGIICRGILIDGDQAVKWKEAREPGTHRSGTLPFMSQDMIRGMSRPLNTTHTALDDLESFTWVLVWECLHRGKSLNLLSDWDLESLDDFKVDSPQHLARFKGDFLSTCKDGGSKWRGSFLSPFKDLLARWAGIRWEASEQMADLRVEDIRHDSDSVTQVLDKMDELCRGTGLNYVRAGLEHLQNLQESWRPTTEAA
ncbi:hypothetical protein B0H15DRAFT_802729 [Mycena belliarum]|uniref:Fungal-type protein kinase domain-containing protein n=1 Tax=Mycena belliarum TaxID=1033014 RepID=A0AAD6TY96_9AGAR|nr:hypothetical protein B0H15DRAFT_802729 [Mycena belliae]